MSTVTVACNLPHGVHMQLYKLIDGVAQPLGERVTLNGGNHPGAIAGWGVTENVDKAFVEKWISDNVDLKFVRDGAIVVREKTNNVVAEVREKKGRKSGFEALDPNKKPAGVTDLKE